MSDRSTSSRNAYAAEPDIFVTLRVAGLHCWPGAPEHRSYLRASHRHQFGVRIETIVRHDDREIEFHDLRDRGLDLLRALAAGDGELLNFGPKSCEMIARDRRNGVRVSIIRADGAAALDRFTIAGAIMKRLRASGPLRSHAVVMGLMRRTVRQNGEPEGWRDRRHWT